MNRRDFLSRIGFTAGDLLMLRSGCAVEAEAESS